MGVEGNPRISEEKGLFSPFSGFPNFSSDPPEKGKKAEKGSCSLSGESDTGI